MLRRGSRCERLRPRKRGRASAFPNSTRRERRGFYGALVAPASSGWLFIVKTLLTNSESEKTHRFPAFLLEED